MARIMHGTLGKIALILQRVATFSCWVEVLILFTREHEILLWMSTTD